MMTDFASALAAEGPSRAAGSHPRSDVGVGSSAGATPPKMRASGLTVRYGGTIAIHDVSLDVRGCEVLALIGPSGCGKSTFLRSLNRMNDTVAGATVSGRVELDGS